MNAIVVNMKATLRQNKNENMKQKTEAKFAFLLIRGT